VKVFLESVTFGSNCQRIFVVLCAFLDEQFSFSFLLFRRKFAQKSVVVCYHFIEKNLTLSAVASPTDAVLHDLSDDQVTLLLELIKQGAPVPGKD
jgi:hypothetical protein